MHLKNGEHLVELLWVQIFIKPLLKCCEFQKGFSEQLSLKKEDSQVLENWDLHQIISSLSETSSTIVRVGLVLGTLSVFNWQASNQHFSCQLSARQEAKCLQWGHTHTHCDTVGTCIIP